MNRVAVKVAEDMETIIPATWNNVTNNNHTDAPSSNTTNEEEEEDKEEEEEEESTSNSTQDTDGRLLFLRSVQRRLAVMVDLPTLIENIALVEFTNTPNVEDGTFVSGPCPNNLGDASVDRCEVITAVVQLTEKEPQFQSLLEQAILQGKLYDAMQTYYPDSEATVLSGLEIGSMTIAPTDFPTFYEIPASDDIEFFSVGVIAGIAVGAVAVLGIFGWVVSKRRRASTTTSSTPPEKNPKVDVLPPPANSGTNDNDKSLEDNMVMPEDDSLSGGNYSEYSQQQSSVVVEEEIGNYFEYSQQQSSVSLSGGNYSEYSQQQSSSVAVVEEENNNDDSASSSSSAAITTESDDLMNGISEDPSALEELEAAIMSGDWAAVGAISARSGESPESPTAAAMRARSRTMSGSTGSC